MAEPNKNVQELIDEFKKRASGNLVVVSNNMFGATIVSKSIIDSEVVAQKYNFNKSQNYNSYISVDEPTSDVELAQRGVSSLLPAAALFTLDRSGKMGDDSSEILIVGKNASSILLSAEPILSYYDYLYNTDFRKIDPVYHEYAKLIKWGNVKVDAVVNGNRLAAPRDIESNATISKRIDIFNAIIYSLNDHKKQQNQEVEEQK